MKKLFAVILAVLMVVSMTGCSLVANIATEVVEETKETQVTEVESSENTEESEVTEESTVVEESEVASDLETYNYADGITVQMEPGMVETESEGFTVYAYSNTAMFAAVKEDSQIFTDAGLDFATYELTDYAAMVQQSNSIDTAFAEDELGNLYVTYNSSPNGTDFFYYATVKKGTDAFWVITFACFAEDEAEYLPQFKQWASTIVVE